MSLNQEQVTRLEKFFASSLFSTHGAVITDLDGTAVHELKGRTIIHQSVEKGLIKIYDVGRPIVINTLRFPLSVIRTFAQDWYKISNAPIPVILLNGSQLGYITKNDNEFAFEQTVSFPLSSEEINNILKRLTNFIDDSINDIILFYYPENWKNGEVIWTPEAGRIPRLQKKYPSASSVVSMKINDLASELLLKPICMILLLVDIPSDKLMAYQHTGRNNFITHQGINKLSGTEQMSHLLNFKLPHSIGAGDSDMDTFLNAVGLSVHVGQPNLSFEGTYDTLKLNNFFEFGDLLYKFAEMQNTVEN